jgi:pimeloyl-ACP methyl ester carboxylesterase
MKLFVTALLSLLCAGTAQAKGAAPAKNIVIVHGAFADGSGWEAVYRILTKDGYNVTIVQNSTASLASDVAATQNALATQDGPVVLVGHSYGGEVITQAGGDPKVKSLVYVAAFAPDVGESLQTLTATPEPNFQAPPILAPKNGFLLIDRAKFPAAFAGDVDPKKARFMAASQSPLAAQAFTDQVTTAAWKTKPSYYLVSTEDKMIPPAAQKKMASRAKAIQFEVKASHALYVSQPAAVARVIERAASR